MPSTKAASVESTPEAEEVLRRRAEQGDAQAQFDMGVKCSDGQGVPQDEAQATEWYLKAAEQENANAQFCLGVKCEFGLGVRQDYEQAVVWFCRAADQGGADALFALGMMYAFGRGVPQDFAEAFMWMHLATCRATGRMDKRRYLHGRRAVANWLTRAQRAEARNLAQVWTAAIQRRRKGDPSSESGETSPSLES